MTSHGRLGEAWRAERRNCVRRGSAGTGVATEGSGRVHVGLAVHPRCDPGAAGNDTR